MIYVKITVETTVSVPNPVTTRKKRKGGVFIDVTPIENPESGPDDLCTAML